MSKQLNKPSRWNYHPKLPIPVSPLLSWPPRPIEWLKWISKYWLAVSSVTLELLAAIVVYRYFQPDWTTMENFSVGWIFTIWLRNIILLTMVAGGLHLWFITYSGQDQKLKFDARDQARNNRLFKFKSQVGDNIFWSCTSGVSAWTVWEVLYFWCAANGFVPKMNMVENPILFATWFVLIPIWSSFHFYWIHRLLHWPPLYKLAHNVHHRNVNIGPWSGISMHPIETALYFSSVIIHFVVPSSPLHVLFHLYLEGLNPAFSHSGFEAIKIGEKRKVNAGDFFHQLHHRYFECNYGTAELPWDKLFGSFHDGTEEATRLTQIRRQKMYEK